jgi:hypothetical protein
VGQFGETPTETSVTDGSFVEDGAGFFERIHYRNETATTFQAFSSSVS